MGGNVAIAESMSYMSISSCSGANTSSLSGSFGVGGPNSSVSESSSRALCGTGKTGGGKPLDAACELTLPGQSKPQEPKTRNPPPKKD